MHPLTAISFDLDMQTIVSVLTILLLIIDMAFRRTDKHGDTIAAMARDINSIKTDMAVLKKEVDLRKELGAR